MARVAILVAGMHRSGTSALTRSLVGLGCDAPKTLMPADDHNAKGYWESTEIAALNDDILRSAGSSWDSWEHFGTHWYASPVIDGFRDRAQTALANELGDSPLFVLKDPRICRLMPFWLAALEDFGATPHVILPLRNPLEVAASLHQRDAIEPPFGLLMWLRNVLDAETESRQCNRAFIRYEELLADWHEAAAKIGRDLGIAWPRQSVSATLEVDVDLTPALRHHVEADARVLSSRSSRWVATTYDILCRWAEGQVHDADVERLDAINATLTESAQAFAHPVAAGIRAGQTNRRLETDIGHLNKTLEDLNKVVADRDSHIKSLDQAVQDRDEVIANKDGQIANLNTALHDRDVRADAQIHAIAGRDGRISALNDDIRSRDGQVTNLERTVAERDRQIEALQTAVASGNAQIEALEREAANRTVQIEALEREAANRSDHVEALEREAANRSVQIEALEREAANRSVQIEALEREAANRSVQIEALEREAANRSVQIEALEREAANRSVQIEALEREAANRTDQIEALQTTVASRNTQIEALEREAANRSDQIEALECMIADKDNQITDRDARLDAQMLTIAERDGQIASLEQSLRDRDAQIEALWRSTSWRITAPLRTVRTTAAKVVRLPFKLVALVAIYIARLLWRLVPLGQSRRQRWRLRLLRRLPERLAARLGPAADHTVRGYVAAGRLDLADLNSEAARNQGPVPILFDPHYYVENNADVKAAGVDPLTHYLEYGAIEGRLPIDIDPKDIDPTTLDLHRFDLRQAEPSAPDIEFYRAMHTDLASLDDAALADHYERHGKAEGRAATKGEFLREIGNNPREIPIDFLAERYIELYPDLHGYTDGPPLAALRHYMLFGRWEPRLHTLRGDRKRTVRQPSVDLDLPALAQRSRPLCVLAHVYYAELWDELSSYLANLPDDSYDLYVNLVDSTFDQQLLANVRNDFPLARIYISQNTGRDIGGHWQVLRNVQMEDYRVFCLAHTKKSPHMGKGEVQLWRRKLLEPLMGSPDVAAENIRLMLADDEIGLLGADRCRYAELNDNPSKYFELLEQLGINESKEDVEFVSGTMMFLRREVLQRLFEATEGIVFELGDDQSTAFHRDGQWAHAVERAFGAVVRDMNYRIEWR